jgi:hypothetical protein
MSTLYVDNLQPNLGSQVEIPNLKPLAGSVINTWQAVKTDTQSSQGFNFVDVTGLSITVTPSSVNSKFLISWRLIMSADYYASYMKVVRDSQTLFTGDTASNRFTGTGQMALEVVSSNAHGFSHQHVGQYLDFPSKDTSTTFKLQFSGRAAGEGYGGVSYINRTVPDRDTATYDPRFASNIIVQEIAG